MADFGAIGGGLALGLFMAISVGPTLFAVIRYSMNHSWRSGVAFVLGVSLSDILYVTAANLAVPFLEKLHRHQFELMYGGGILLVLVGLYGLLSKYKPQRPSQGLTTVGRGHYLGLVGSGFLMNSLNPAVIIQWIGAVAIIAPHGVWYRVAFFTSCLSLVLGVDFLKVLLADSIRKRLTLRLVMYLNRLSAAILLGFGIVLIVLAYLKIEIGKSEAKAAHAGARSRYAQAAG